MTVTLQHVMTLCWPSDEELVPLLTLADEYQVDQVKVRCQEYIGEQLATFYQKSHAEVKRLQKQPQKPAQRNKSGGCKSDWLLVLMDNV